MHSKQFYSILIVAIILIAAAACFANTESNLTLNKPPLRFAIIGDRTGSAVAGVYEEVVAEVERLRPDFVITVGDHIQGYTEDTVTLNAQWDEYFSVVKPLTMPFYITPGNHDITTDKALGTYEKRVGHPYYSFNTGNYHFIVLDVSRYDSSAEISQEEYNWLANDLKTNNAAKQTLVFFHKPFWYDSVIDGKPDKLHDLFVVNGVDAVFNGHFHSYFTAKLNGILYTAVGSSGGVIDAVPSDLDFHFTWITVDDTSITIAPIKKGSVKAWDIVLAPELHFVDKVTREGMKVVSAAPVADNLNVPKTTVSLELYNAAEFPLNDTLRWEIPKDWTVEPSIQPIVLNPKEKKQINFQVSSSGDLYPVPTATLNFPYAKDKTMPLTKGLRLARVAKAAYAAKAPIIDGKLNDQCWSEYTNILYDPDGNPAAIESTWFYFAYDKKNLYLAARCRESKMDSIVAKITAKDGAVYGEDCVGFFVQPDIQQELAYQLYFNPQGVAYDARINRGHFGYFYNNRNWNGKYTVKTSRDGQYWCIEVSIPLSQFKVRPATGQDWGINFLRKQKRLNTAGDWQVPIDYDPQSFGVLRLK